jgi:hypothetical protein
MWAAYRADMTASEVLDRPSMIRADHATLLRHDSRERGRTLAFWASFDANPLSGRRWVDSCAAYWGAPAGSDAPLLAGTTTP